MVQNEERNGVRKNEERNGVRKYDDDGRLSEAWIEMITGQCRGCGQGHLLGLCTGHCR